MHLSPDNIIFWQMGFFKINATMVSTWFLMLLMVGCSMLITRRLSSEQSRSRLQNLLELIVCTLEQQLKEGGLDNPRNYIDFLGTLFLFVAVASVATVLPIYEPPTGSLSTTVALALCVFIAVPLYGILRQGVFAYLKSYMEPSFIMLPFNIIGEVTRTIALAVRLFGNMMSGALILGILLAIAPLLFPIILTLLGLLAGLVQAYIFFTLATVYIAAATDTGKAQKDINRN